MTTMWKPRGPQKPKHMPFEGIKINQMVQFCRDAQHYLQDRNEMDQAVTFEILADYFENDFKIGQQLVFKPMSIGC